VPIITPVGTATVVTLNSTANTDGSGSVVITFTADTTFYFVIVQS
jgi:hypothetical protein